jgi:hypothetical protein
MYEKKTRERNGRGRTWGPGKRKGGTLKGAGKEERLLKHGWTRRGIL